MGFYLWVEGGLAWAEGSYEYRPLGTAVISATDLFRRKDFDPKRRPPKSARLVGQFASLGHVNLQLKNLSSNPALTRWAETPIQPRPRGRDY